jgi:glycosyltransferase involved in cell wall biosynthesis
MPAVSVCLPVCNGASFVQDAIRSILWQTTTDLELIIVDDGSTDDSVGRIQAIQDDRIRLVLNGSRRGIPGNWNHALTFATAPYVCVFHQDDVMAPANLASKLAVLESRPSIAWVHSAVTISSEAAPRDFSGDWLEDAADDFVSDGPDYLRQLVLHGNRVAASSVVARRAAVLAAGSFQPGLPFACDYELWLRLCALGEAAYIASPLVTYRWHDGNATHQFHGARGVLDAWAAARSALRWARQRPDAAPDLAFLEDVADVTFQMRVWLSEVGAANLSGTRVE